MNDINHNDPQQTGFSANAGADPAATDDVGIDEFDEGLDIDQLAMDGPSKKRRSGALVLVAVIGLAIGGLFSMRTLAKVTASTGANTEIEKTIEEFLRAVTRNASSGPGGTGNGLVDRHGAIWRSLNVDFAEQQVPLTDLQADPFAILDKGPDAPDTPIDPNAGLEERRAHRRAQFEQAAGNLRLQSIMMGSKPLAMINSRIVRAGELMTIRIPRSRGTPEQELEFRIASIERDSVTVVVQDAKLELTVETVLRLKRDGSP